VNDFSTVFGVVGPCIPADMVPVPIDIFDGIMILADVYIICALS
jgi:hypothetical protein